MSESKILSREVITEWAARGQRGKRAQSRQDELQLAAKIGGPIKAELISLATPLMDYISKRGLAGVSIPIQDAVEAKDIHVNCYPLHEEIQCVLDKWGCIYIEVDASTSRQRLADSHEAIRAEVDSLRADRDNWKEAYDRLHERYQNVSGSADAAEKALDVAKARVVELEADASTVAHLRTVLQRVRDGKGAGAHFTDSEVAGQVRMLTTMQLDHEMVCVMARDRIIALSDEVESLRRELDEAIAARDSYRAGSQKHMAELAAAIEAGKADTTRLDHVINRSNKMGPTINRILIDEQIAAWQAAQVEKPE